jgi:hypothetical protein
VIRKGYRREAGSEGSVEQTCHLKQFSGHAPPESLEEYVELEELGQNHPLRDVL